MSRIRCRRTLAIAAAMLGVGLATWGAQAVRSQAEAAGRGGSGIGGEPWQQDDYRVAAGTREEDGSRRRPAQRGALGAEVAASRGGTGAQGSGFDVQKGSQGHGFDTQKGSQGHGFDTQKDGQGGSGVKATGGVSGSGVKATGGASGSGVKATGSKTFIIDHPSDPRRYLVHATLEGPEGAVFYRGSARLDHGRAEVALPSYFESLTHTDDRTVILTNIDGFDRLAVETQRDGKVANGRFVVISDNPDSAQAFDWEVKAVRKDVPRLVEAPLKTEISVAGFGPYTFIDRP
jgi:hypothetical protein